MMVYTLHPRTAATLIATFMTDQGVLMMHLDYVDSQAEMVRYFLTGCFPGVSMGRQVMTGVRKPNDLR